MRFYEIHVYLSVEWAVTHTGAHVEGVTLSTMWLHEKKSHGEVKAAGTSNAGWTGHGRKKNM